ncbi:MAG: 1-acyl-sn-glycerol-3-phosphate acyltransferase [Acidobacteriota bacterium]|nr:MAG: 1-acyl-sn-glycerol-3-phosphate acyltransferase [Acidobacteriota bacterium]
MKRLVRTCRFLFQAVVIVTATVCGGGIAMGVLLLRFPRAWFDRIQWVWASAIRGACGVRVRCEGAQHVRSGQCYIVVANHRSHFDLIALFTTFPAPLRAMAKRPLFHIPLFGWAMALAGYVPVDRTKKSRRPHGSLEAALDALRRGRNILVFPEGTRNTRPEAGMLPFHSGAFRLAKEAGVPLLPVAILGGERALPPRTLTVAACEMEVRIGSPISAPCEEVAVRDLSESARRAIEALLEE